MFITLIAAALIQSAAPGAWLVDDETSALDGKRSVMIGVESETPLLNAINRPEKAMLSISCIDGKRGVTIIWPTYLGNDEAYVDWKIGDGEIRSEPFYVRGTKVATITGRSADRFLGEMGAEGRAVLRVNAYRNVQEATFDLTGAGAQLATVREACPDRRGR